MYAIALINLIEFRDNNLIIKKWFADNSNAAGSLENLKKEIFWLIE